MGTTVRVRKDDAVALPDCLCRCYAIKEGDILKVVNCAGVLILTPKLLLVAELAHEIEQARLDAGLTTEEFFDGLRK
jgi:hypothetical protein